MILLHHEERSEAPGKNKRAFWPKFLLGVLIVAIIGSDIGLYVAIRKAQAETARISASLQSFVEATKERNTPPVVTTPVGPTMIDVAGDGEGGEHPLIRQLTKNSNLVDFPACHNKPMKQRIGCNAHLLAIRTGIVDWKFGSEMRVKAPNTVAFVIEKDAAGNPTIAIYAVSTTTEGGLNYSRTATYSAAPTVGASHFIGPMDGTSVFQTPHLYMYAG